MANRAYLKNISRARLLTRLINSQVFLLRNRAPRVISKKIAPNNPMVGRIEDGPAAARTNEPKVPAREMKKAALRTRSPKRKDPLETFPPSPRAVRGQ